MNVYIEELERHIQLLDAEVGVAYEAGYREGYDQADMEAEIERVAARLRFFRQGGWIT